jgi:hypothetical protein
MLRSSRLLLGGTLVLAAAAIAPLAAQAPKKLSATALRTLDNQAEKAKTEYLKSLHDLAKSFDDAGLSEKSRSMLEAILAVNPDDEVVKRKLKELDEAVFKKNDYEFKFDTGLPWQDARIFVTKDQPIRIEAEGDYKVFVNETLGPEGYSNDDPAKDLVSGIPMGALMLAMTPPRQQGGQGTGNRQQRTEDIRPVAVGKSLEFTPKSDGPIYFKVNVPPGSKATGILRVTIRGNFKPQAGVRG